MSKVVDLIHGLADAHDIAGVLGTAMDGFHAMFGSFLGYLPVLSDNSGTEWILLPLENPRAASWGGVPLDVLEGDTDLDTLSRIHGKNVSDQIEKSETLRALILGSPFLACCNLDDVGLLERDLKALLPPEVRGVLLASWIRPTGGRGLAMIGFAEPNVDPDLLPLFGLAVKLVTRMAFYPGFASIVRRMERISHSLRRNIVHDLKSPVVVIKGYAETLMHSHDPLDPATQAEMLRGISEQADRLLDDLKEILEPITSHWTPHIEAFDLATMVQKVAVDERHTARALRHTFELEGTDRVFTVHADRRKIRRVLENLLGNAVKYSPGDRKVVRIVLERRGEAAVISFEDQGIGMTPEQLERVMSGSGRAVTSELGIEGSGFGLESCRRVLEAHGGLLHARSTVGVGSIFEASFPIVALGTK